MRETTVLCELVCGAEPAEAPNGADFALRRDDELCAHDGESRIGVFDASESDGRTRHARGGRLHSRYRRSSGGLPQYVGKFRPNLATGSRPDLGPISESRPDLGNRDRKLPVAPAAYQLNY